MHSTSPVRFQVATASGALESKAQAFLSYPPVKSTEVSVVFHVTAWTLFL